MFVIGDIIGPYRLLNFLGRGAFGEVWLAERSSEIASTRVALKIPFIGRDSFEDVKKEAELWILASGHPNVIPIFEANVYDGQIVIASEFANGGNLEKVIEERKIVPPDEAVRLIKAVLEGLRYLHGKRVIHRDIKPANILLQDNIPRLSDFGISRVIQTDYSIETIAGTPSYMAPEAFEGIRNESTDLWSVSIVFFELVNGYRPFQGSNVPELITSIIHKEPKQFSNQVPLGLRRTLLKGLSKDPRQRYESAGKYLDDISKFERSQFGPSSSTTPEHTSPSLVTLKRSEKWGGKIWLASGVVALLLVVSYFIIPTGQATVGSEQIVPDSPSTPAVQAASEGRSNLSHNAATNRSESPNESNSNQLLRLGIRKERRPK